MSNDDRSWMYNRRLPDQRGITDEFKRGLDEFINFAKSQPTYMNGNKIRCPCTKCRNKKFLHVMLTEKHLLQNGFQIGYKRWISHGEQITVRPNVVSYTRRNHAPPQPEPTPMNVDEEPILGMEDMVRDAAGPEFDWRENSEQEPTLSAKKFIDAMESAKEKVYSGCKISVLDTVSEFLNIKSDYNISQAAYNRLMKAVKRLLPEENKFVKNFYETKKMVGQIGLSYEKIDACKNDCMLFYKENSKKTHCSICKHSRYKEKRRGSSKHKQNIPHKQLRYMPLIPRLQRLYASKATSEAMRWHKESLREEGVLIHPCNGEAWKHFDNTYPNFAAEARNIRLCICSDGFNPFGPGAKSYSCWPVIATVYNFPPWLCMSDPYMFLSLFIPGPYSPGKNIDVYLRPLMDELKKLWEDGVETWDSFKQENFTLKAALMWTVNDFPAYGMLSGWSTHGKLACPYCMSDTKSFTLKHSRKPCWFDCHRQFLPIDHPFRTQKNAFKKNTNEYDEPPIRLSGEQIYREISRLPDNKWGKKLSKEKFPGFGTSHNWTKKSIFWELSYWKTNMIRHNLDVMHIEKNVFDNIFNTLMDFKTATKDTVKGRMDLKEICKRPTLELIEVNRKIVKPVAAYVLTKENKLSVLKWLKGLRLPDGYASNIGNCVNVEEGKIQGLKSHDCHVLLDRLLPSALRDLVPDNIWVALTELSESFRALTSTTLRVDDMRKLEESIVVTLCKLEKIFPPSFFDSMEHLPVHLAYEARVGGPVQYRWMYPFERFLGRLKRKMSNRARVEASISEAVIIDEIVAFASTYFDPDIVTRLTRVGRNHDGGCPESNGNISVFSYPGRFLGKRVGTRMLTSKEFDAAHLYVLLNCPEVEEYLKVFEDLARDVSPELISIRTDKEFPSWLRTYIAEHPGDTKAARLKHLAGEPHLKVHLYNGYYVNGYVFRTKSYGNTKATWNIGVNLKGNLDYYGVLTEIIELQYLGRNNVVLFNCEWRDVIRGIKKHDIFDLVDVKDSSRHVGDDVFILASQAQQVYMTPYPHRRSEFSGWWAVWKTKARSIIDEHTTLESSLEGCYQEDEMPEPPHVSSVDHPLDDTTHLPQDMDYVEENVLLADSPPASALPDHPESEESENELEYEESESNDEDELEFCNSDTESEGDIGDEDEEEDS